MTQKNFPQVLDRRGPLLKRFQDISRKFFCGFCLFYPFGNSRPHLNMTGESGLLVFGISQLFLQVDQLCMSTSRPALPDIGIASIKSLACSSYCLLASWR